MPGRAARDEEERTGRKANAPDPAGRQLLPWRWDGVSEQVLRCPQVLPPHTTAIASLASQLIHVDPVVPLVGLLPGPGTRSTLMERRLTLTAIRVQKPRSDAGKSRECDDHTSYNARNSGNAEKDAG